MANHQNMLNINAFWNTLVGNMNRNSESEIVMPIGLKSMIGQQGIDIVEARFRNMIEAPVTVIEDPDHRLIRIVPARNPLGHDRIISAGQNAKSKTFNKAKVARPPNAFILYRQHHHPLVRAEYPELHNNQISIILGSQWKHESDVNKAQYVALASRLKALHLQEHPGYQYQPRKPGEKKRRMTRGSSHKATTATTTPATPDHAVPDLVVTGAATLPMQAAPALPAISAPIIAPPALASAPVSTLYTTAGGNAVINLGGEEFNEKQVEAMLTEYNAAILATQAHQAIPSTQDAHAVLYNERSEDAQNDANFYGSMVDLNPTMSSLADLDAYFDFMAASLPSPGL